MIALAVVLAVSQVFVLWRRARFLRARRDVVDEAWARDFTERIRAVALAGEPVVWDYRST